MSDLHLEATPLALDRVNADVVLAGDIEPVVHGNAPRWARKQFPTEKTVWVLGNHEHYGFAAGMDQCIAMAFCARPPGKVHVSNLLSPSLLSAL